MSRAPIDSRERHAVRAIFVCAVACAAACKVGPDYRSPEVATPAAFASASAEEQGEPTLASDWWRLFGDEELDTLETAALAANQDLQAAAARVVQARAATRAVGSQFYPIVTLDPSIARSRTHVDGNTRTATDVRIPFDVSYEVDLWGRVARAHEAAEVQAQASSAAFGVVLQTLAADVAQNWFTLRSLDLQQGILARSIELFAREVELTETRQRAGIAGQTDVLQAREQLETARAQESEVRRQRADVEHALAILTGQPPSDVSLEDSPLAGDPPPVPAGLPSDLLRRRPDVAAAEQSLVAANASVGVAHAGFYPTLSLSGSAGFESTDIDHALDWENRFWSIGAGLTAPLFEGGRLSAELERSKAVYDESLAAFRATVLDAFREVEDSLTDLHRRADAAASQQRAVDAAREYRRLAELQYAQGILGYLQVIDAERTLLSDELAAAQILEARYTSTVLLIKALGGGWTREATANDPRTQRAVGPER